MLNFNDIGQCRENNRIEDPRNTALIKMFNLINIGERAGSGLPNIYAVWKQQGWPEPQLAEEYDPDRTILSLSIKKSAIKIGDKSRAAKTSNHSLSQR